MSTPTTMAEFTQRFARNQYMDGFGLETTMHVPCPFCGAIGFACYRVLDVEAAMARGSTCTECGRSAKALFDRTADGVAFELVQTGGPDQPEWLTPKMRRVDV